MSVAARPALRLAAPVAESGQRPDERPDLVRLCAGEPVALLRAGLVAFSNTAHTGLDPDTDPDHYQLAEVILDQFHSHIGVNRQTKGDRAADVASSLARYVLPWAIELAAGRPPARRGIAYLRLQQAEDLPRILSGDLALPAATVAGDLLGRVAITCLWLTLPDAARVTRGGATALRLAVVQGALAASTDRGGQELVFAADLRAAALLIEPALPHGLARSTATGIVKLLSKAVARGCDLGAHVPGRFTTLAAVEPLVNRRLRAERGGPRPYISIGDIAHSCASLTPTHQLALWLMRLVGLRIGETFGLLVSDFHHDPSRAWLQVQTQGGQVCWVRDEYGRLVCAESKSHTKTAGSTRRVPIARPLADLIIEVIRIYHTDLESGKVNPGARLIPGLRSEDSAGISALRAAVDGALQQRACAESAAFEPHDLRAAFITDLANAGVDDRLSRWYVGHSAPVDVHSGYDLGPDIGLLDPVADVMTTAVAGVLERSDLRVPTTKTEQWGRGTRRGKCADLLRGELRATGWLAPRAGIRQPNTNGARPVSTAEAVDVEDAQMEASELAFLAGVSHGTARRWMREGALPAEQVSDGARTFWTAYRSDVDAFLAAGDALTIDGLAGQLGMTYAQTWALLGSLALPGGSRSKGAAVVLSPADVAAAHAEVTRRAEVAEGVMMVSEAAKHLNLPPDTVGTLLRQGRLMAAPAPDGTRHTYVDRASLQAFAGAYPPGVVPRPGDLVVPVAVVRRVLGVTRPMMTHLIGTRQLSAVACRRKQAITLVSLMSWLGMHPVDGAPATLRAAAVALPARA